MSLNESIKGSKLFIDTSTLMHDGAPTLLRGELRRALASNRERVILPLQVYRELERHRDRNAVTDKEIERRQRAHVAVQVLREMQTDGLLDLRGEAHEQFPDGLFQQLFIQHRTRFPLALITQDVALMVDILGLQESHSVQGIHPIRVWTLRAGELTEVPLAEAQRRLERQRDRKQNGAGASTEPSRARTPALPLFEGYRDLPLAALSHEVLSAPRAVAEGASLKLSRDTKTCTLGPRIGSGGEGDVFRTSIPGMVAKVFHASRLTRERVEKIKLMVSRGLDWRVPEACSVCWPIDLLIDADGVPRGYLMAEARGVNLANAVFVRRELEAKFPTWRRRNLVRLCITILRRVAMLHRANILIGDINPRNLLVESDTSVFFVDTDSYQLEGHPCPVGTVHFTSPDMQGFDFSRRLRRLDDELFAVATLIFMILHAGKAPYAQLGGESPVENIRAMRFPYPLGEWTTRTAPEGPWRYIWSHLTFKVKEAFYQTFDEHCRGIPRRSAAAWIELLEGYAWALDKGHVTDALYPTDLKAVSEHAQSQFGAQAGRSIPCVECGATFTLSARAEASMRSRGLQVPKRCKDCRAKRKATGVAGPTVVASAVPTQAIPPVAPPASPQAAPRSNPFEALLKLFQVR